MTDKQVESFIGTTLRIGVVAAALIGSAGGALLLIAGAHARPNVTRFLGEPGYLTHVPGILHAAFSGNALGIMQLGLLVLIAVPITRVAVSLLAFVVRKDWLYCAVTGAVLGLLVVALATGR